MAKETKIGWCHSTFNPWTGCTKIGPGCDNCYAEAQDARWYGAEHWGAGAPRQTRAEAYWRQPVHWNLEAKQSGEPWRVFCASQADVFDNEGPAADRARLFELIKATPHLTWLLLTKRVGNVEKMLPADWDVSRYQNVWLGITVVNQEEYDRDVPKLCKIPAAIRWLSIEPQLDWIRLSAWDVDWYVDGGESRQLGKCRPFDIEWAMSLARETTVIQKPLYMKQLGHDPWLFGEPYPVTGKGDDISQWPTEIRRREFPNAVRMR